MSTEGDLGMLSDSAHPADTGRGPQLALDDKTLQDLNLPDKHLEDSTRKTGDWTVYRFYFENIGWPLLSIFLACCVLFILGLSFPRQSSH